jgi:NADH-quinone oxidoreductase subunit F
VTILYRRERKDMPAAIEEIVAAEEEGIKIEFLVAPVKIVEKGGKVSGIACQRMKLGEFDRSGRKRPVPMEGSDFTLGADAVIAAIGQVPDMSFVPKESGVTVNKWDTFDLAKGSASLTHNPKFYAGGDAVTGPDTVIGAIAAGHQAANDIDGAIRAKNGEPAGRSLRRRRSSSPSCSTRTTRGPADEDAGASRPRAQEEFRRGGAGLHFGRCRQGGNALPAL